MDTTLFRPKEEIEHEAQGSTSGDMSRPRPVKRASFDIYADQIERLGVLKYRTNQKISDMVRDAIDEYLTKHER